MKRNAIASLVLLTIVTSLASGDSSGYPRSRWVRQWKDAKGRVIKRVDRRGRMHLFTYDDQGRIIQMAGVARRVDPKATKGQVPSGGNVWVHVFHHEEGHVSEFDCLGRKYQDIDPKHIRLDRGTSLPNHQHGAAAGSESDRSRETQSKNQSDRPLIGKKTED